MVLSWAREANSDLQGRANSVHADAENALEFSELTFPLSH
jgi:hypothetical protein